MICSPLGAYRTFSCLNTARYAQIRPSLSASPGTRSIKARARIHHKDLHKELTVYIQQEADARQEQSCRTIRGSGIHKHHNAMAFLLPGLRRGLVLSTPLILSTPLLVQSFKRPVLCDGPDPLSKITSDLRNNYAREAQTTIIKTSGAPNPRALRQVSMGSILGVLAGLGVSVFSKPLAILIGLGIVCVQVSIKCHSSLSLFSMLFCPERLPQNYGATLPFTISPPSMQFYTWFTSEYEKE